MTKPSVFDLWRAKRPSFKLIAFCLASFWQTLCSQMVAFLFGQKFFPAYFSTSLQVCKTSHLLWSTNDLGVYLRAFEKLNASS